jgi:hypothetical protein
VTADDVKRSIAEKAKRGKAQASTHMKIRLQRLLDQARSSGDQDAADK